MESFFIFLHFDPSSSSTWGLHFSLPDSTFFSKNFFFVILPRSSSFRILHELPLGSALRDLSSFLLQREPSTCNISTATRRQRQLRAQRRGERILRKREALKNWNRSRSSYLWSRYWFTELRRSRRGSIQEAITIRIDWQTWNQGSRLSSGKYRYALLLFFNFSVFLASTCIKREDDKDVKSIGDVRGVPPTPTRWCRYFQTRYHCDCCLELFCLSAFVLIHKRVSLPFILFTVSRPSCRKGYDSVSLCTFHYGWLGLGPKQITFCP